MPLNSAGDAAHSANANWCLIAAQPVSFKFVTLKRKRASTFPYSWVSQWKEVFRVFLNEMNCTLLISVLRLLNIPSLVIFTSGDWRKLQYSNHFKSWQAISYRFWWRAHGFGSVSDISLRKRDIYLMQRAIIGFLRRWGRKISSALLSN